MAGDDDIAASLPRPPFPAPARREAAIGEALRRFDGAEASPAQAAEDRREARPSWWSGPRRPYAGALAGAFLVALVGLPWAWTSLDNYTVDGDRKRQPSAAAPARQPGPAAADAAADAVVADFVPPGREAAPGAPAVTGESPEAGPVELARVGPAPLPTGRASEAAPRASEEPAADKAARGAEEGGEVVVSGARIRRPDLESAVPLTSVGQDSITVTGSRSSRAARRGDWNACTIEDPSESLERCRNSVNTVARGARGRGSAHLADGLARAWTGDLEGATVAFDRAIEAAPRSSAAYLNRGLAWRKRGDLDRAIADLDRAVRYSPRDARSYYQRSLVLRQRGDLRRARADEESAVALDHRYAPLVK